MFSQIPGRQWLPVYTQPRHEKKLAASLGRQEIPFYLPLLTRVTTHNRSKRISQLPMFPGYLFAAPGANDLAGLRGMQSVIRVIQLDELSSELLLAELRQVRQLEELSSSRELEVKPELVPGKRVVVGKGPCRGLTGVVVYRKNSMRLVVNLEIINNSVATEIDAADLELE